MITTVGMSFNIAAFILMSINSFIQIIILSMATQKCCNTLSEVAKSLKEAKRNFTNTKEIGDAESLLDDIGSVGPFTGGGFFDVEQKPVTSMVGSTITYLIVLVQFKLAEPGPSVYLANTTSEKDTLAGLTDESKIN